MIVTGKEKEKAAGIELVVTPASPVAPSQAVTAGLGGVASTFANPSSTPISASSSSSSSSSSAVDNVAKSTINTQELDNALKQVDTAIAKEISITGTILRTVLRLKQDKAQIDAFTLNPFARDAALALHNFKAVECKSNDEVQKLALDASNPYMKFIRELEGKIAAHKKSLENKFKSDDASAQKQVNDQISALLAKHSKDIDKLKTIFIDDVVKNREALLYFVKDGKMVNRDFTLGGGANNTYYVPSNLQLIKGTVMGGGSISTALIDSKAIVIQRKRGPAVFDGIGAMGGLIETTRRHFPAFDEGKYNAGDLEFRKYLQEQYNVRWTKLDAKKVPEHEMESTKHVIKTADALLQYQQMTFIQYAEGNAEELRKTICACLDDVEFDAEGNIKIIAEPLRSAQHAAEREGAEESGELQGLGLLLNTLSKSVKKDDKAQLLMGGDDTLVDDNFFLSLRGISAGDTEAQSVSPVILGSKCAREDFEALEKGLKQGNLGKFVNPMTHGEIAGVEVLSLNALRRRAGVSVGGKALSEEVTLKGDLYGKYAYRYVHEYVGTALKLSIMQLSEAMMGDVAKLRDALILMAGEDQMAVFEVDNRDHKINLLSAAKIMFKKDIKMFEQKYPNSEQKSIDEVAYELLAKELNVKGVTVDVLVAMDAHAHLVYKNYNTKK